jgi:putative heme iron utilization protein
VKADHIDLVNQAEKRQQVLMLMQEHFGEIVDVLMALSDFKLFKLGVLHGRYVEGFGKAFNIEQGLTGNIQPAMSLNKNE